MTCRITLISQQGALLDGLLEQIADSVLKDAHISLVNASVDYKTSSVLHKGRPLGFSFIDDFSFAKEDLVMVLESELVVSAYKDTLMLVDCPVIGFYKDIKTLNPHLYVGELVEGCQVYGVMEPMVAVLKQVLQHTDIEAMDVKAMFSAELSGQAGITELASQTARLLNSQPLENRVFTKQLPFNFYPLVENKSGDHLQSSLISQLKTAFNIEDVHVFALQLPVFHGQTLIVSVVFSNPLDLAKTESDWQLDQAITLLKDPSQISHLEIANADTDVLLGCYQRSDIDDHRLDFWLTIDENPFAISESLMPLSELLLKNSL